jgi:uncharacterized protein
MPRTLGMKLPLALLVAASIASPSLARTLEGKGAKIMHRRARRPIQPLGLTSMEYSKFETKVREVATARYSWLGDQRLQDLQWSFVRRMFWTYRKHAVPDLSGFIISHFRRFGATAELARMAVQDADPNGSAYEQFISIASRGEKEAESHEQLPPFHYHPDPIATGSIERSSIRCVCCERQRGYVYCGPVFALDDLHEAICPWCIANSEAHLKFNAEFTDSSSVGESQGVGELERKIVEEVAFRTPGFSGWQQERWLACCNDAAQFLGRAGRRELQEKWPEAVHAVQEDCGLEGAEWEDFFQHLSQDGSPSAYVFRCSHCKRYLAYQDCE